MPSLTLLSAMCSAAVLERTPGRSGRSGTYLRVTPRFLAHAEESSSRLSTNGRSTTPAAALAFALSAWDEYRHDPHSGALLLVDLLEERGQLGLLRPVFPMLEQFAQAAA